MVAKILHFGWDDCYRVQVLRGAGFAVVESETLEELCDHLQRGEPVDAVILSEAVPCTIEQAAAIVRTHCAAPMILFRRSLCLVDESAFDLVFAWFIPPPEWLEKTAELIAQSPASQERKSPAEVTGSAGRNRMAARTLARRTGTQRAQRS